MADKATVAYFCEPFMISGLLPTLGPPILKQALMENGIKGKVFYPSLHFFLEDCEEYGTLLLQLADDIPLQITEFFFMEDDNANIFLDTLPPAFNSLKNREQLLFLRKRAREKVDCLIRQMQQDKPGFFCFSVTFGTSFAKYLLPHVRKVSPDTTIVVGGSCCTPIFAAQLRKEIPSVDYIVCDETPDSLVLLIKSLSDGSDGIPENIDYSEHSAKYIRFAESMDSIPIPNFDDYFAIIDSYNIPRSQITLPYEMSRGCWWCQIEPCNMCGFFGARKAYTVKSPEKVVSEIEALSQKYEIKKFRFSDLVQPVEPMLTALSPLSNLNLRFFWELRPDISFHDLYQLRSQGMTYAQIGLESLNTGALIHMNKGTTAIQNIQVLIWAQTLKLDVVWNYLYGLPGDQIEWYDSVVDIFPFLYHLQPPIPRRCWENQYSKWYFQTDSKRMIVRMEQRSARLESVYNKLKTAIAEWHNAYKCEYRLCVDRSYKDGFRIIRDFGKEIIFDLTEFEATLYCFFFQPHTLEDALETGVEEKDLLAFLRKMIRERLMIKIEDFYLSTATDSSRFKWIKSRDQVLNFVLPDKVKKYEL